MTAKLLIIVGVSVVSVVLLFVCGRLIEGKSEDEKSEE